MLNSDVPTIPIASIAFSPDGRREAAAMSEKSSRAVAGQPRVGVWDLGPQGAGGR